MSGVIVGGRGKGRGISNRGRKGEGLGRVERILESVRRSDGRGGLGKG
jgi:hypothetical protein